VHVSGQRFPAVLPAFLSVDQSQGLLPAHTVFLLLLAYFGRPNILVASTQCDSLSLMPDGMMPCHQPETHSDRRTLHESGLRKHQHEFEGWWRDPWALSAHPLREPP
jgi:hypothetical protein